MSLDIVVNHFKEGLYVSYIAALFDVGLHHSTLQRVGTHLELSHFALDGIVCKRKMG